MLSKFILLLIFLIITSSVSASDFSGMLWPVMIFMYISGTLLFWFGAVIVYAKVKNKFYRRVLCCFLFGLFLGPVINPNSLYLPNIFNVFSIAGGKGILIATGYALIHTLLLLGIFWGYDQFKNQSTNKHLD